MNTSPSIKVSVYGASGYTAGELLRLLSCHPQVRLHRVLSESQPDTELGRLHPHLIGSELEAFKTVSLADSLWRESDCVFFAAPSFIAMEQADRVLQQGGLVVDLSADFRIKDLAVWSHWYKAEHSAPALVKQAVYGLTEAQRDLIAKARLIANPGCYATAIELALLPLLKSYSQRLSREELIVDAKSGLSGAGRRIVSSTLFSEASEDLSCYAATGHRHQAEVEEFLLLLSGASLSLRFVPHLVPMSRGLFADVYLPLGDEDERTLRACYEDYYKEEPFVSMLPQGESPHTKSVRGTNQCHLALFAPPNSRYIQVCSALDNLMKGAAGQAIQNMNVALGLQETAGLVHSGLSP